MVPFPNVPTDSLYKFKALSGIIILLAVTLLFITESDRLNGEQIRINTKLKLFNHDFDLYKKQYDIKNAFLTQEMHKVENKVRREEKVIQNFEKGIKTIKNKIVLFDKLKALEKKERTLATDYMDLSKVNANAASNGQLFLDYNDKIQSTLIKIDEQQQILSNSRVTYKIIIIAFFFGSMFGLLLIVTGFKQWKQLQDMSDELTQLQLEKTRKEVNGDKPKLILPN